MTALSDLLLQLENLLGIPFAFILMAAVFVLFCWLSLSIYKSNQQVKTEYETEIRQLKPSLHELSERQRQTSEAFARFLQLLETQYGQLAAAERLPELPGVELKALPPSSPESAPNGLLQGIDPDVPRQLRGGTLVQLTIQADRRVARYAFPAPGTPRGYVYQDLIIASAGDPETPKDL
ncbi:MAG: hypothetical protein WC941_03200 [Candidatus Bathyarchaeia archaeon]